MKNKLTALLLVLATASFGASTSEEYLREILARLSGSNSLVIVGTDLTSVTSNLNAKVEKSGDTMTGSLTNRSAGGFVGNAPGITNVPLDAVTGANTNLLRLDLVYPESAYIYFTMQSAAGAITTSRVTKITAVPNT